MATMARRILCVLLAALLIASLSTASAAKKKTNRYSYDFDLTFSLNAEAFPRVLRARMSGYADLVNRLGIRGNIAWTDARSESMELNATLYFTDNDAVTYPFRIFGIPSRVYITSSMIRDEVLFLNMPALMAFSSKARNTLNIPLSYFALLYPYSTTYAFHDITTAWEQIIGTFTESAALSLDTLSAFSAEVEEQILNNQPLQYWIRAVSEGSEAPDAVEAVYSGLPSYYHNVTGDRDLSVEIADGSETWKTADGRVLFSRAETDHSVSADLALPAEAHGYQPSFSFSREVLDNLCSFDCRASLVRARADEAADSSAGGGTAADDAEEEDGVYWPDCLLDVSFSGSGFPASLLTDANFSLTAVVNGALYPNGAFVMQGETKSDGSLTVELYKPSSGESASEMIFRCSGTLVPGELRDLPNYKKYDFNTTYSVFSFNETSLAEFNSKVLPSIIRSVLSFVEAAPTSACQSLLDDLTEMGVLDMLLK